MPRSMLTIPGVLTATAPAHAEPPPGAYGKLRAEAGDVYSDAIPPADAPRSLRVSSSIISRARTMKSRTTASSATL